MTSRRDLPASDPVLRLRLAVGGLLAVLALLAASPLATRAGASVVTAPAEHRSESTLDPTSTESAAPDRQVRSRTSDERSRRHLTNVAPPGGLDSRTSSDTSGPVLSRVPDRAPPGRAPPSLSA